jgi:RNA polymerase sigma factor for flagellar operon FliA
MKCSTNTEPDAATNVPKDKEREQIILEHMKQVEAIAKRISSKIPPGVDYADLFGAGILGLIDAAGKFDPSHGVKFKTFAEYRIRGAILDSLRDLDWAPRNLRIKNRRMKAVCGSLEQHLGRAATEEEKCNALGIDLAEYYRCTERMVGLNINSLETLMDAEKEKNLLPSNGIRDLSSALPFDLYERCETKNIICEAIDELPKKERTIICLYYYEQMSMANIGKILGVNESRISQLHSMATRRLKKRLRSLNAAA